MILKANRRPTAPGVILLEFYLKPRRITQKAFAEAIGVSRKHVSAIVSGRQRIEPEVAVRFSKVLDTTPDVWLNLQHAVDVWDAEKRLATWRPANVFDASHVAAAV